MIASWVGLILLTFVSSVAGTMAGFGLSTIMVPTLLLFFPPVETLMFVGIIHVFGDAWKILLFRSGIRWRLLAGFAIPAVLTSFLGARLSLAFDETLVSRLIALVLIAYAASTLFRIRTRVPQTPLTLGIGGAASGFFTGAFGIVGGAIRGAFLSAYDLPKAAYIASAGAIAAFVDTVRLITYAAGGARLETSLAWILVACVPASFAGAVLARGLLARVPQRRFRQLIA